MQHYASVSRVLGRVQPLTQEHRKFNARMATLCEKMTTAFAQTETNQVIKILSGEHAGVDERVGVWHTWHERLSTDAADNVSLAGQDRDATGPASVAQAPPHVAGGAAPWLARVRRRLRSWLAL